MIENRNKILYIHNNEVKIISEFNLLHYIINPPRLAKNINSHYSPIIDGWMNTRKSRAKFKNLRIILDSGCISTIVMGRLVGKLFPEKYSVMQWTTQAGNITTNFKAKIDFTLPALSAKNFMTWKCHVNYSNRSMYYMILGRYMLTELVLNLKNSKHVIESDNGPLIGSTSPMVDLGAYVFKYLNTVKITPE